MAGIGSDHGRYVGTAEFGVRFGEELRSERERRGISLERLCADTKVNQRFIEALERGEYQALPGGVFRRGFVRAYLKAVALDEAEWLPRFDKSYGELTRSLGIGTERPEEDWAKFAVNVKRNRGASRQQFWKRWLGVLAMLLLLMAAAWAVWHFLLAGRVKPVSHRANTASTEAVLKSKYRQFDISEHDHAGGNRARQCGSRHLEVSNAGWRHRKLHDEAQNEKVNEVHPITDVT